MRFHAVAVDFDGTLAHDGVVPDEAIAALEALRKSGRRPILATGRIIDQLAGVFPRLDLFDAVVAENGAVLYDPASGRTQPLVAPPPPEFAQRLLAAGVSPLEQGHVIVAARQPHEVEMLEAIRQLGLEISIIFNKGAVMALPAGVTKASGLGRQLELFRLSFHNVVGIGDAENDLGFLSQCEAAVAVANALPSVKEQCDIVTARPRGHGVCELVERLVHSDLEHEPAIDRRHRIALGKRTDGSIEDMAVACPGVLVAGTSGGGKSTLTAGFIERVGESGYQYCVIDPEGDFADLDGAIPIGTADLEPSLQTVEEVLVNQQNAVISLIAVKTEDRPLFARRLLNVIAGVRSRFGRPHWAIIDEAHHLLPTPATPEPEAYKPANGTYFITTRPKLVAREALACVNLVIAVGDEAGATLSEARAWLGDDEGAPLDGNLALQHGEVALWRSDSPQRAVVVEVIPGKLQRRRHQRKYAKGELAEEKSFYFTGPHRKLNLRARNLITFVQIGEGVDDETWTHHLRRHDYSAWVHEAIGDDDLEAAFRAIEDERKLEPAESRRRIADEVRKRYTAPA